MDRVSLWGMVTAGATAVVLLAAPGVGGPAKATVVPRTFDLAVRPFTAAPQPDNTRWDALEAPSPVPVQPLAATRPAAKADHDQHDRLEGGRERVQRLTHRREANGTRDD